MKECTQSCHHVISHRIHVCYIYLHLPQKSTDLGNEKLLTWGNHPRIGGKQLRSILILILIFTLSELAVVCPPTRTSQRLRLCKMWFSKHFRLNPSVPLPPFDANTALPAAVPTLSAAPSRSCWAAAHKWAANARHWEGRWWQWVRSWKAGKAKLALQMSRIFSVVSWRIFLWRPTQNSTWRMGSDWK